MFLILKFAEGCRNYRIFSSVTFWECSLYIFIYACMILHILPFLFLLYICYIVLCARALKDSTESRVISFDQSYPLKIAASVVAITHDRIVNKLFIHERYKKGCSCKNVSPFQNWSSRLREPLWRSTFHSSFQEQGDFEISPMNR